MHVAVDDLDVGRRGLEHLGRLLDELLAHLARGVLHRATAHRSAAAAAGADEAERRAVRVAVDDLHVVAGHAELVGDDLTVRRLVALAVRHLRRVDLDRTVGHDRRPRLLAHQHVGTRGHRREVVRRSRGRLVVRRDPEPQVAAGRTGPFLFHAEGIDVDQFDRPFQRLLRRHRRVECRPGDHRRRHVVLTHHVLQAQVGRPHAEGASDDVEHPLARPRLVRPRSPVRDIATLVGGDGAGPDLERVPPVRTGEHHPHHAAEHRHRDREGGVRTLVEHEVDTQAAQRAVVVDRDRHGDVLLAGVAAVEQVLAAVLDPLERATEIDRRGRERDVFARRPRPSIRTRRRCPAP